MILALTNQNMVANRVSGLRVMQEKPKQGIKGVVLVWIIGLTLGVVAGASTARLLMPARSGEVPPEGASIRDRMLGK